jgi:DNA replication protein DnaC
MTTVERLRTTLVALNLTAVDARLESLLENASKKEPSYGDFLLEVMSAEADARRQRYLKTRLQLAHLPYLKTFDQFDFGFQPSIDERQIRELRTLRSCTRRPTLSCSDRPVWGKRIWPWHWRRPRFSPDRPPTS